MKSRSMIGGTSKTRTHVEWKTKWKASAVTVQQLKRTPGTKKTEQERRSATPRKATCIRDILIANSSCTVKSSISHSTAAAAAGLPHASCATRAPNGVFVFACLCGLRSQATAASQLPLESRCGLFVFLSLTSSSSSSFFLLSRHRARRAGQGWQEREREGGRRNENLV